MVDPLVALACSTVPEELVMLMGLCAQQQKIGNRNNLSHSIFRYPSTTFSCKATLQFLQEMNTK